jgi:hypothetical protein
LPEGGAEEPDKCVPGGVSGSFSAGQGNLHFNFSSFEEFVRAVASQGGLAESNERFDRLLDLLAQKGVMTEEEKDELKRRRE